jgi:hypothetical protein
MATRQDMSAPRQDEAEHIAEIVPCIRKMTCATTSAMLRAAAIANMRPKRSGTWL